jgi:CO/xanthine dehydrogenase Mo-binding subunit
MEPHATIAQSDGDKLILHDATQYISGMKQTVSKVLGTPEKTCAPSARSLTADSAASIQSCDHRNT